MCQEVRMVKTTEFFIFEELLGALIHLKFIILILICVKLMMPGINYVIYGSSSARATSGVSLYWSLTFEENRVKDDNLKRQVKTELCVLEDYSY